MIVPAFPLQWPEGHSRHKGTREAGAFRTSLATALDNARKSLAAFSKDTGIPIKAEKIVFSSNVGGLGVKVEDPGIALWFEWDGAWRCIAVDRYSKPEANLQAIHHIIEADRTKLRHGSLEIIRSSYKGFIALPAPPGKRDWRDVLELSSDERSRVSKAIIEGRYRYLAEKHHPDRAGGSHAAMTELNAARDEALKEIA